MRHRVKVNNIKALRKGDPEACKAVICRHYKSIYRFLAYLTQDASLAEDLTQDTFVSAWAKIDSFKGRALMRTWLHKIAYHKFIDSGHRLKRFNTLIDGLKQNSRDVHNNLNPLYQLTLQEHTKLLYEAVQKLDAAEYIVIVLHYIQEISFRNIAKILDKPSGTIKWRMNKALKKLRKLLKDWE
ncbi:RNA polymerase sigma factor [Planctomycetota bacterium]